MDGYIELGNRLVTSFAAPAPVVCQGFARNVRRSKTPPAVAPGSAATWIDTWVFPFSRCSGIGYSTAKKIVELRLSLSGERFSNLDQLKRIGRVDWDEVIAADLIYVG